MRTLQEMGVNMKTKIALLSLVLAVALLGMFACSNGGQQAGGGEVLLATTTSTENSGLLDYLLPVFKEDTGIEVKVVSVGTGQAIQMGKDGEADVLLVHDTLSEEAFVAEGHAERRDDVMYNDFILIGAAEYKEDIAAAAGTDIVEAFTEIATRELPFVSRGDDSGTHKMELRLWEEAGITTEGTEWYVSVGKGMGDTIMMAEELNGFTLSDRATYLSMKEQIGLEIVLEGDERLFNQYGVIVVDPSKNDQINHEGAKAFADWLLSDKGQQLISQFGVDEYGQSLFVMNAK